jgi:hypothetical protein
VQKTRKLLGFDFGQKPAKRGVCSQVRILKGLEERKQNGLLKLGRGQVPWQQMKMLGSLRQKPSARTDQKASGPKGEPELRVPINRKQTWKGETESDAVLPNCDTTADISVCQYENETAIARKCYVGCGADQGWGLRASMKAK